MREIDSSEVNKRACKAAHKLTIQECESRGIKLDIKRDDIYYYTDKAQDIFNQHYDIEYERIEKQFQINLYNKPQKSKVMKKERKTKSQKKGRKRQLIFIEYTEVDKGQHYMTVVDSYRNIIGRGYKTFDVETGKFEHIVLDHEGKLMFEKSYQAEWKMKHALVENKEQLLKDAHQRRLDSKEQNKGIGQIIEKDTEKQVTNPQKEELSKPEEVPQKGQAEQRREELSQVREDQEQAREQEEPTPSR